MMTSTDQQKNWSADHSRALSDGILRDKNKTSETEVEGWFTRISLTHTSLAQCFKRQTGLLQCTTKPACTQIQSCIVTTTVNVQCETQSLHLGDRCKGQMCAT